MRRQEKGFSLPELLIVVGVVGVIAAIAVPGLLKTKQVANEAAAIQSLRNLVSAQNTYICIKGSYQSYGNSEELSAAGLVDELLLSQPKSGYLVTLTLGDPPSTFTATSEPQTEDASARYFYTNNDGVIHYKIGSPAGPNDLVIPR